MPTDAKYLLAVADWHQIRKKLKKVQYLVSIKRYVLHVYYNTLEHKQMSIFNLRRFVYNIRSSTNVSTAKISHYW